MPCTRGLAIQTMQATGHVVLSQAPNQQHLAARVGLRWCAGRAMSRCRASSSLEESAAATAAPQAKDAAHITAKATVVQGRPETCHSSSTATASTSGTVSLRGRDPSASEDSLPPAPFLIGVCGGTASGKTSVCRRIIELLKADKDLEHQGVVNISQDCFYKDLTPAQAESIRSYNFDHPDAFDFAEIFSTLAALKQGAPVHIPHYDFVTSSRLEETTFISTADVILFDGIMAFHQEDVRNLFDLKIFVDTDADLRLARRVRRDIAERGRDIIQVLDQYEKTVKPSFDSFIQPTKKYSDVIVPRGVENTAAIDLIHQHVRLKLLAKQGK